MCRRFPHFIPTEHNVCVCLHTMQHMRQSGPWVFRRTVGLPFLQGMKGNERSGSWRDSKGGMRACDGRRRFFCSFFCLISRFISRFPQTHGRMSATCSRQDWTRAPQRSICARAGLRKPKSAASFPTCLRRIRSSFSGRAGIPIPWTATDFCRRSAILYHGRGGAGCGKKGTGRGA